MTFAIPTLDELHGFLVAHLRALLPDIDVSPTSFPALFERTTAAAVTDAHAHIDGAIADLWPDKSSGAALDRWGRVLGRPRKGATGARKAGALRVINGDVVSRTAPAGTQLVHVSGLLFQITASATIAAGDFADVDIAAIDTGVATRLPAGEDLQFVTPIAGLVEIAALQRALDEDGQDQESHGAYRARLLERWANPPLGGAAVDYVTWALASTAAIAAAYCLPNRAGRGTVDVVAFHLGTGTARALTLTERSNLANYLSTRRPTGATVRVLETVAQSVDVEVLVQSTGEAAYAWDWEDPPAAPQVSTWTSATRTLVFNVRPDSMAAGGRLVIRKVAGTGAGEVLTIESLSGIAGVVLEVAPTVAPVAGDEVFAAGPLTTPVRSAILALLDGIGPANPAAVYGAWEGTLRTSAVSGATRAVVGVRDLAVVTPAANVDATDPPVPDDAQINYLVPGRVLVRRLVA